MERLFNRRSFWVSI